MWYPAGRGRVGSPTPLHRDSWYLPVPYSLDTWCCLIWHLAPVPCPIRCTARYERLEVFSDVSALRVFGLRFSVGHVVAHERQDRIAFPDCRGCPHITSQLTSRLNSTVSPLKTLLSIPPPPPLLLFWCLHTLSSVARRFIFAPLAFLYSLLQVRPSDLFTPRLRSPTTLPVSRKAVCLHFGLCGCFKATPARPGANKTLHDREHNVQPCYQW